LGKFSKVFIFLLFWGGFTLIRVNNISVSFGERTVLKNISWMIPDGTRAGLVGDNGAGKTTFLRLLSGESEPDGGSIERARGTDVGYLPQDLVELGEGTVMEFLEGRAEISSLKSRLASLEDAISRLPEGSRELASSLAEHEALERGFESRGGYAFEPAAKKILRGLGFLPGDGERRCVEFSGGWRMRIALAAILLRAPGVMLLDEPTNHLDTESMEWLEGWLRDYRGIMIFVSHDRRFLGHMATEIADLSRGTITHYSMGYENYLAEKEAARERLERAVEDQREQVERTRRFIERFRYKSSKAAQVQSRVKQLEKMEILEADSPALTVKIKFPEAPRSGYEVTSARGLAKSYGGVPVFDGVDLEIKRGERIALVGVNGAGKSTLLRLISGAEPPTAGEVKLGRNVKLAYFSQESAQNLDYSHTVWEEACRAGSPLTEAARRNLLGAFLFSGDDIKKSVRVLSGGEKSRLSLFKLLLSDSNFLVLDEPTNHLDMNTREIFQRALLEYGGTLLIVSHDRFFLDSLAERVLEIRGGKLYSYLGNYSYFIERREELLSGSSGAAQNSLPPGAKNRRRDEAAERNRLYREKKIFADEIEAIEKSIALSEKRRGEIDEKLCDPAALSDSSLVQSLMIERREIEDALAGSYAKWESLSEAMDGVR
jgi:ATP-binding cassette subfamily F protein 3